MRTPEACASDGLAQYGQWYRRPQCPPSDASGETAIYLRFAQDVDARRVQFRALMLSWCLGSD